MRIMRCGAVVPLPHHVQSCTWLALWARHSVSHSQSVRMRQLATPPINHNATSGLFLRFFCPAKLSSTICTIVLQRWGAAPPICGLVVSAKQAERAPPMTGLAHSVACVELTWRVADHYRPKGRRGGSLQFRTPLSLSLASVVRK